MATDRVAVVPRRFGGICVDFGRTRVPGVQFRGFNSYFGTPYSPMAQWKSSTTRQPPMSKDELRLMLAEAVRNTQPVTDQRPKGSPKAEDDQP